MEDKKIITNNDEVTIKDKNQGVSPLTEENLEKVSGGQIFPTTSNFDVGTTDGDSQNSAGKQIARRLRDLSDVVVDNCEEKVKRLRQIIS